MSTVGYIHFKIQFSSVAQMCLTLCQPMDCSTPGLPVHHPWTAAHTGLPVHHHFPEFAQIHVHRISDAIQPYHPLSSPILLPSVFPSIRVFSNESAIRISWSKYWSFSFNIGPSSAYSGLISFMMDWLAPCSPSKSQESSPTPQFKSISSLALSFLHSQTVISLHDYWKNHSFD